MFYGFCFLLVLVIAAVGSVNARPARTLSAKSWTWDKPMKTNNAGHTTMKNNGLTWNKPMKNINKGGHTTMKNNGLTWSNPVHASNGLKGNKNKDWTWNKPSWKKNGATHA